MEISIRAMSTKTSYLMNLPTYLVPLTLQVVCTEICMVTYTFHIRATHKLNPPPPSGTSQSVRVARAAGASGGPDRHLAATTVPKGPSTPNNHILSQNCTIIPTTQIPSTYKSRTWTLRVCPSLIRLERPNHASGA